MGAPAPARVDRPRFLRRFGAEFLIENVFANEDAVVANVDPGPLDQFLNLSVGFSAETAQGNLCGSRHGNL